MLRAVRPVASLLFDLLLLRAGRGAWAHTTVTLQEGLNGYVGTTDTQIASAFPTTNYGANGTFGMVQHTVAALIRFPIFVSQGGPVPDGASIASATLSVHKIWGPTRCSTRGGC
jgi:hypothetical protein